MELTMGWWVGFNLFVLAMLALDLGVFHRRAHEVRFREAITWSIVWIALALAFGLGIYLGWFGGYGPHMTGQRAKEFFAGYLVEKALSVDNVFVFAMIFSFFSVPAVFQHRVLFFGIIGALVLRAAFILGGVWLVEHFEWALYLFAIFLVVTGVKMIWMKDRKIEPENNPLIRLTRRIMPVSSEYDGQKFFTRVGGRLAATPLLLVLLFVETTDLLFAIDSIPAILILTQDTFIVYTSNVFAILGLRALYFALAGFMKMFALLSYGLSAILIFIGGKMFYQAAVKSITGAETKFPIEWSLGVIGAILVVAVVASLVHERLKGRAAQSAA